MNLAQPGCFVCRKHRDRGDAVPHLHVHLLPRFPGTPREYWWTRVDDWPDARRGDAAAIGSLVHELRAYLAVAGRPGSVRPSKST